MTLLPEIQGLIMTVLFVLLGIVVIIALKKGWLANFRAGKDGVQFDTRDNEILNKQNAYDLQIKIIDIDENMREQCRKQASEIRRNLFHGLYEFDCCDVAKAAISYSMSTPLSIVIDKNHMRKKLTPSRKKMYIEELVREVGLEYDTFRKMASSGCDKHALPIFDEIHDQAHFLFENIWVRKVIDFLNMASEAKIKVYEDYLLRFRATGDAYNINICEVRIERNRQYIRESKHV